MSEVWRHVGLHLITVCSRMCVLCIMMVAVKKTNLSRQGKQDEPRK